MKLYANANYVRKVQILLYCIRLLLVMRYSIYCQKRLRSKCELEDNMLHIALCDDEEYFIETEKKIIEEYLFGVEEQYIIDIFSSGEELLKNLDNHRKYDLVFLDVQMVELSGFETARRLRKFAKDIYIVFVSINHRFATEGYKVNAFRYIIKNDKTLHGELTACLDDYIEIMHGEEKSIELRFRDAIMEVKYSEIVYIESDLHDLVFHLVNNQMHRLSGKLDEMEDKLNDIRFCRTHQSFLVNLSFVEEMNSRSASLVDRETNILVTRSRYRSAKDQFLIFKGKV